MGHLELQGGIFNIGFSTKIFIVMMLVTNTVTMLNFFVTAHASLNETLSGILVGFGRCRPGIG